MTKVISISDKQREKKYGTSGERLASQLHLTDDDFLNAMRDQDSPPLEEVEEDEFAWVLRILEKDSAETE